MEKNLELLEIEEWDVVLLVKNSSHVEELVNKLDTSVLVLTSDESTPFDGPTSEEAKLQKRISELEALIKNTSESQTAGRTGAWLSALSAEDLRSALF